MFWPLRPLCSSRVTAGYSFRIVVAARVQGDYGLGATPRIIPHERSFILPEDVPAQAAFGSRKSRQPRGRQPLSSGEQLHGEDQEAPAIKDRDGNGQIIRRVPGETGKGFHRVAWDLRYPAPEPKPRARRTAAVGRSASRCPGCGWDLPGDLVQTGAGQTGGSCRAAVFYPQTHVRRRPGWATRVDCGSNWKRRSSTVQ
jgi:hypothetical protein